MFILSINTIFHFAATAMLLIFSGQFSIIVTADTQQPCAAAYQLWRLALGCNVPAPAALRLQWISSFTRRETKRALGELENSGLLRRRAQITLQSLSPEEGFHKAFMGYVFRVQA